MIDLETMPDDEFSTHRVEVTKEAERRRKIEETHTTLGAIIQDYFYACNTPLPDDVTTEDLGAYVISAVEGNYLDGN